MKYGLPHSIIESIQQVLETNPKLDKALLFGSRAKGNYREASDIDLAVKGQNLNYDDLLSLGVKLDDLNLPYKVDLIDYHSIKEPALTEHIDRAGIDFYSMWKKYTLGELCTKIGSGATPTGGSNSYQSKGISLIRSQNVLDFNFGYDGLAFINDKQAHDLKNVTVKENDILLNITGDSVARVCKVAKDVLPARVNQHVAILRANNEKLDSDFLLYQLQANKEKLLILSEIGGTRNALTKTMIQDFEIVLPPLSEQRSIASTLSSLDDKIDLLHRQNKKLDQLAETLFRQWFVEEADESWEVVKVRDVAEINSRTVSKSYPYSEIEYLDTGSINDGSIEAFQTFKLKDAPSRAQRIVVDDDIVYSLVRPIQRHYGLLHGIKPNTVASTGFCVITCKDVSPYFIYLLLTSDENVEYFEMIAEASTSAYPSLKPSDISNFEFLKPPSEKLLQFSELTSNTWSKIKSNKNQIHSLTKLRDTLLPKLMSGEVRVNI